MTPRIAGQLALVTGASSGIGEAIARRLAGEGANLVLWARRAERLTRLAEEIAAQSRVTVDTGVVDVRDYDLVRGEAERLIAALGAPDILVNNAGLAAGMALVHDADVDDWDRMIDTNVKGLLYVTRAFLPAMVERDSGQVVNIGSIAGRQVYPGGSVYAASKYAVQAITEGTNLDVLGTGVRVSGVHPGLVETEFALVRFKGDEGRARAVYKGMEPLTGADVAEVVSYVLNAPPHINVADVVLFAKAQGSVHHIHRDGR
ncbi:SDR family NAD(P)-dependent oxidoreductase [Candidatus Palauibacter sp.]|uniref:SDR family NAD(P)-dependent oxidoreductase n=1 Tax=Candidatus Palauibacter sp. TaxID=3101350 RepID=UPI003B026AF5